jgi:hypothetical protein
MVAWATSAIALFPDQGLHKEHFRAYDLSIRALHSERRTRSSVRRQDEDDAGDLCLCPRIILKADEKPGRRCWAGPFPSFQRSPTTHLSGVVIAVITSRNLMAAGARPAPELELKMRKRGRGHEFEFED